MPPPYPRSTPPHLTAPAQTPRLLSLPGLRWQDGAGPGPYAGPHLIPAMGMRGVASLPVSPHLGGEGPSGGAWAAVALAPLPGLSLIFTLRGARRGEAKRMRGVTAVLETELGPGSGEGPPALRMAVYDRRGRLAVAAVNPPRPQECKVMACWGRPAWEHAARGMTWWLVFETDSQLAGFKGAACAGMVVLVLGGEEGEVGKQRSLPTGPPSRLEVVWFVGGAS